MKDKVVVSLPLRTLFHKEKHIYATRVEALGLTSYSNDYEESREKAKRMFAALVQKHRKARSLEEWLENSGLEWCWESQYQGEKPVESFSPKGFIQILDCHKEQKHSWGEVGILALA